QSNLTDFRRVPMELVGFPSGFMLAGVPGVIGTLWPVSDISTAVLLGRFYANLLQDRSEPALALNSAQQWLRDSTASELGLEALWRRQYEVTQVQALKRDAFKNMRYWALHPEVK